MNYTEKYHLPQWVKTDRIMMEDFNAAMAGIEKGLSDSKTEISKNQSAAENSESKIWNAMTRCARNILVDAMEQNGKDKIFCVNGLLCHPLTTKELTGTLSGGEWDDTLGVFAGRGMERTDIDLKKKCISFQGGHTKLASTNANACSFYEFTAPVTGVIRGFTLFTKLTSINVDGDPHLNWPVCFTAKKKVGSSYSELVYRKDLVLDKMYSQGASFEDEITIEVPIIKGSSYYLELKPSGTSDIYGRFGFVVERETSDGFETDLPWIDHSQFRIYGLPTPSVTVTRTLPAEGQAVRAVAAVRYRKDGTSPAVHISLGNKDMSETAAYERADPDGKSYMEAWYSYQSDPVSGDLTVKVTMTSAGADEGRLLEYGVMLL